jgi:xanthine/uracil permease
VRIVAQGGFSGRTMLILAVASGLGLGVQMVPEALAQFPEAWHPIVGSPLILGTMCALILNLVIPPEAEEDGARNGVLAG